MAWTLKLSIHQSQQMTILGSSVISDFGKQLNLKYNNISVSHKNLIPIQIILCLIIAHKFISNQQSMAPYCKFQCVMIVIITFSLFYSSKTKCHYSCKQCVTQQSFNQDNNLYTTCTSCPYKSIKLVYDSFGSTKQSEASGLCVGQISGDTNIVGVCLIITLILMCLIFRSKRYIYISSCLQNLALIGFVECGWIGTTGYLLQSLQYLLIFNVIDRGQRNSVFQLSMEFSKQHNYRLMQYFRKSTSISNVKLVGIVNVVIILVISCITIYSSLRQNERDQLENGSENNPHNNVMITKQHFESILTILFTIFFLLIQETTLTLVTLIKYNHLTIDKMILAVITFGYISFVCLVSVGIYYKPLFYFNNLRQQYSNLCKKIMLPICLMTSPKYHYLLLMVMVAYYVIEGILDFRNRLFRKFSRLFLYKLIEGMILLISTIYYITERYINTAESVNFVEQLSGSLLIMGISIIFIEMIGQTYDRIMKRIIKKKHFDSLLTDTIIKQKVIEEKANVNIALTEEFMIQFNREKSNQINEQSKIIQTKIIQRQIQNRNKCQNHTKQYEDTQQNINQKFIISNIEQNSQKQQYNQKQQEIYIEDIVMSKQLPLLLKNAKISEKVSNILAPENIIEQKNNTQDIDLQHQ